MNKINKEKIDEIKSKNNIQDVISKYVKLTPKGSNLIGLCPFHNEKTPSFTVYPKKDSFYCFGCGTGGDVIEFTRLVEKVDYISAVKLLAERSGVKITEDAEDNYYTKMRNKISAINQDATKFYQSHLKSTNGKWAAEYLSDRGLSNETIENFQLGCAPKDWNMLWNYLKAKGYNEYEIEKANLITKSIKNGKYYDRFRNRIMFPIKDIYGNIIAFSSRINPEENDGAKYMNTADTFVYKKRQNLFGIDIAKNHCAKCMILVEGNMDVISLHQAGFKNVVAPLGTALTEEQIKLLAKLTKEIVLLFDADVAGQKATEKVINLFKGSGLSVCVVELPNTKDPDEFIKKNGAEAFKALLNSAVCDIEYKLLSAEKEIEINSDTSKLKYLTAAAEIIASSDDVLAREVYIDSLSRKYSTSKEALTKKVAEFRKTKEEETQDA